MRTSLALSALLILLAGAAHAAPSLTLARDGEPAATIVVAAEPSKAAEFAACELQWHIQKITGATLPIVKEGEPISGTRILVGESSLTRALGYKNDDFGLREYTVKFLPDTLVLIGRDDPGGELKYDDELAADRLPSIYSDRGSAFAVYDFLEKSCGVRWYRPGPVGLCYPEKATLTVTGTDIRRAPMARFMQFYYGSPDLYDEGIGLQPKDSPERAEIQNLLWEDVNSRYPLTDVKNLLARRKQIQLWLLRLRTGGEAFTGNHSFYGYYDRFWEKNAEKPELWEEAHPEYFAQGYEGKPGQMCYTNRGFINQVIADAREYFDTGKKRPGAQAFGDYFGVVPQDWGLYCKCPDCMARFNWDEAATEQFNNGQWSDYIWWFTNEVAKELRKTHPDKYLVQLAYSRYAYYPKNLRLEPNIAVQLCLHVRNWWCPAMEANDIKMLSEWATKEPGRPLYMFNYYGFPQENSQYGKAWHCFPGFFGHTAARQAQLYKQYGVRGIFFCGVPTEPDHYFVTKLYDDPDLDFDQMLDDYVKSYYAAAGEPIKQMYLKIEQTFGDPRNYPLNIQRDNRHYHQTEELAWAYLGTEKRMAELQRLMDQATALAQTDLEKRRVKLFRREVWDYMVSGKHQYTERSGGARANTKKAVLVLACRAAANGDPDAVDWAESTPLYGWRQANGEGTTRALSGQMAHDRKYLYLQLTEELGAPLQSPADLAAGDYWEILAAKQVGGDYRALLVSPEGKTLARAGAGGAAWESGARVRVATRDGYWVTRVALPLPRLVADGVGPEDKLYLNVMRRSGASDDQPLWVSTHGDYESTANLGEVTLDAGAALPGLDLNVGPQRRVENGLVGWWQFREGQGTQTADSTGMGATGTLTNWATWTAGRTGKAVWLNGRGQFVDLGDQPQFHLTGSLTLEAWFRPTRLEGHVGVVGRGSAKNGSYGLQVRQPGGSLGFELVDAAGRFTFYNPTDVGITVGQWNHTVATYDGRMMRVYLNGREVGEGKPLQAALADPRQSLTAGSIPAVGSMSGAIDEVALYDRALTRAEVWQNYLAGKPTREGAN